MRNINYIYVNMLNPLLFSINIPVVGLVITLMMLGHLSNSQYEMLKMIILIINLGCILIFLFREIVLFLRDRQAYDKNQLLFYLFIVWIGGVIVTNYFFLSFPKVSMVTRLNIFVLYYYVLYFFVGNGCGENTGYISFSLCAVFWSVIGLLAILHLDLDYLRIDRSIIPVSAGAIHLYLADIFAILSICVIGELKNGNVRYLIFFISLFILFILGSRTSLYAFCLTLPFMIIVLREYKGFIKSSVYLIFFVLIVMLILGRDAFLSHRMVSFLITGNDTGITGRIKYFWEGMSCLMNTPIMGDYVGQVKNGNGLGSYIHNYFSIWRQFGLVPFILFLYFAVQMTKKFAAFMKDGLPSGGRSLVYVLLFVFNMIEIIFSRSYVFPFAFISIGMWVGVTKYFAANQTPQIDL